MIKNWKNIENRGFKVSFSNKRPYWYYKSIFHETFVKPHETSVFKNEIFRFHKSFIATSSKSINNNVDRKGVKSMKPDETFKSFMKIGLYKLEMHFFGLFPQMKPQIGSEGEFQKGRLNYLSKITKNLIPY